MAQASNQAADEVRNAAKPGEPVNKGGGHGGAPQPSGPKGDNPATAGPGPVGVVSGTPENALGHLNPSSPEDGNTTPGSTTVK
ncbi:hypothetical protein SAMN05421771_0972 [Granulicella pectinivorans]|jgi:hypothetical protein|uniref:Uncharacterized protein n=1 Tax=Granulicella pectinivorans TaxID=474950 RepID=A0A1I6LMN8_9BACT|nr:hypothetical protein [Granulicella pectinivorans]SFS04754.1 hypothetical protein SAMN05421771_0972 [Granulicella pectinivorans]